MYDRLPFNARPFLLQDSILVLLKTSFKVGCTMDDSFSTQMSLKTQMNITLAELSLVFPSHFLKRKITAARCESQISPPKNTLLKKKVYSIYIKPCLRIMIHTRSVRTQQYDICQCIFFFLLNIFTMFY